MPRAFFLPESQGPLASFRPFERRTYWQQVSCALVCTHAHISALVTLFAFRGDVSFQLFCSSGGVNIFAIKPPKLHPMLTIHFDRSVHFKRYFKPLRRHFRRTLPKQRAGHVSVLPCRAQRGRILCPRLIRYSTCVCLLLSDLLVISSQEVFCRFRSKLLQSCARLQTLASSLLAALLAVATSKLAPFAPQVHCTSRS